MDLFPAPKTFKPVQQATLLPHERVLRFAVQRMESGFKSGWLFYKCRDEGLLDIYERYNQNGIFNLLEHGSRGEQRPPILTIELVPKTCWFSNVRSNVSRAEWDKLRKASAAKAQHRCEICEGQGHRWPVECHEIWDYEDNLSVQRLTGLISLCPACHEVKHMGHTELRGKLTDATAHLAIINRWSYQQASEYVSKAFNIWSERSKKKWTLDISWLSQHGIEAGQTLDRDEVNPLTTNQREQCSNYSHHA